MKQIDKSKPVMVTGATGFVAGWLVKKLLDEGITVHAAVRSPENEKKVSHLKKLAENSPGNIKLFKADLLDEGSYAEAMKGCELVYHTASPFTLDVKDAQKELIDPALNGTRNVLNQAKKTESVKRVVLTSSCAAVYGDNNDIHNTPDQKFTEEVWNTSSSLTYNPYSYSKTVAEKEAWKIADTQDKWDLVAINPPFVMGPAITTDNVTSESFNFLKQLGDGTLKSGVPDIGFGVVDVRDLAIAHYNAGFLPNANGRNIVAGHNTSFPEMTKPLFQKFGKDFPIPKSVAPKWLLWLVGPLVNRTITRKYISNNVGYKWVADNSKSKKELDMTYRPLSDSMVDAFQQLVDNKILTAK